jgi:uncharacterized protein (UPF0333 family)
MFEAQQEKEKSGNAGMWIGIAVIVVVAAALAYYVMGPKSGSKSVAPAAVAASSPAINEDAVKDIRVVSIKIDKDTTGTVAVWAVELRNTSHAYTYKNITYKTTYLGGDQSVITQNTGTLNLSLDPGESQTTEFRDLLYPSGMAAGKFNVTGASASQ